MSATAASSSTAGSSSASSSKLSSEGFLSELERVLGGLARSPAVEGSYFCENPAGAVDITRLVCSGRFDVHGVQVAVGFGAVSSGRMEWTVGETDVRVGLADVKLRDDGSLL